MIEELTSFKYLQPGRARKYELPGARALPVRIAPHVLLGFVQEGLDNRGRDLRSPVRERRDLEVDPISFRAVARVEEVNRPLIGPRAVRGGIHLRGRRGVHHVRRPLNLHVGDLRGGREENGVGIGQRLAALAGFPTEGPPVVVVVVTRVVPIGHALVEHDTGEFDFAVLSTPFHAEAVPRLPDGDVEPPAHRAAVVSGHDGEGADGDEEKGVAVHGDILRKCAFLLLRRFSGHRQIQAQLEPGSRCHRGGE